MRKVLVCAFTVAVVGALLLTDFAAKPSQLGAVYEAPINVSSQVAEVSGSPTSRLDGAGLPVAGSSDPSAADAATDVTQKWRSDSFVGSLLSGSLFLDFRALYVAGKLIDEGRNPYSLETFTEAQYATGYPRNKTVSAFPYPPILLYPFALLALLPLLLAGVLWSIVSIAIVGLCCRNVVRFALPVTESEYRPNARFLIFITLAFWPLWKLLLFGQITAVLLFAALYGFVLFMRGQTFSAGLLFSLFILKPHIMIPLIVAGAIWVVIAKEWRACLGISAGTMFHLIVTQALWPTAFVDYGFAFESLQAHEALSTPTMSDFVLALSGFEIPSLIFILVGVGVAAWIALTRSPSLELVGLVLLPLGVLFAPYAWSHDFVLLLPGYLVLAVDSHSRLGERTTSQIAVTQALVFLVVFGAIGEVYTFPFALMVGLLLIWSPIRRGIRSHIAPESYLQTPGLLSPLALPSLRYERSIKLQ